VDLVNTPIWSDNESNPEESKKTKKERKKVVFVGVSGKTFGAWLKNSNNPIVGVDRRGDRY
jgi:hypothetical protein